MFLTIALRAFRPLSTQRPRLGIIYAAITAQLRAIDDAARASRHVNTRARAAMMIAVARHVPHVPSSQAYYDKKRAEGKKHNQAIRALGRQLIRVIWSLVKNHRLYEVRSKNA